ncbi:MULTISPECIES: DUF255 domain-containing protein [unclassified Nitratiruptor]|uniref:thioredoxin family protein n=1 Tax=unclassified Nitratiruptor TaxID=2624044 RepID=UPI0019150AAC|nr:MULTISPECIES: DUF255 domain-containing protein [unclassified Nitratiruptor]BCD59827.1 hypothetical protein NitYY0810_C0586 [Nitratiruptor sp. YY08-10]BCD63751.1 hypothetical protein NitYY0814_C0586 [Nitratiruptor sp. YY08-14]
MKQILGFILFSSFVLASSIKWQHNFQEAYDLALQEKKPLFVFIERVDPPCRWCNKMKTTTLQDPKIIQFINQHFIAVRLDRDTSSYPGNLFPKYVPTIYVIQRKKVIKRIIGYWSKKDFWSDLEDIKRTLHLK